MDINLKKIGKIALFIAIPLIVGGTGLYINAAISNYEFDAPKRDYDFEEGKLIAMEMVDLMCLELVDKNLITSSITLHVGYSNSIDEKPAHGTCKLSFETSSDKIIVPAVAKLYEDIVDKTIPVRRMSITCNKVVPEEYRQYSFFEDMEDFEPDFDDEMEDEFVGGEE